MDPMARAASEHFHTPQPIVETLTFEDERVNRYVWYPGEDLPWPEILGGWIRRCRVTPIVPFLIWERINDVPEDMRKAVRRDWMDRDHQEAQYEVRPAGIFDAVMGQYHIWGCRELTALKGMRTEEVATLNLDATFCPWPSNEIPKAYSKIEAHIRDACRNLNGNQLLQSVGREMLGSIFASRAYDQKIVDELEAQKEPKYSNPIFRALDRLERRRRDQALNDLAAAQNKVFDKVPEILSAKGAGMDPAITELLKGQQQQIDLLTRMLADRKVSKPQLRRRRRLQTETVDAKHLPRTDQPDQT